VSLRHPVAQRILRQGYSRHEHHAVTALRSEQTPFIDNPGVFWILCLWKKIIESGGGHTRRYYTYEKKRTGLGPPLPNPINTENAQKTAENYEAMSEVLESHVQSPDIFLQIPAPLGAGNGNDIIALCENPGQC